MAERHKGRCLNGDDMGLGKTMQSTHAAEYYRHGGTAIVICPNPVKYGWQTEIAKHTGLDSYVCNGRQPPANAPKPTKLPPYIIINWEILDGWVEYLMQIDASVAILDEVQYAKNLQAQRTKAMIKVCNNIKYIFPLSGTPIENGPMEFYPILHLMWPDEFPSKRQFGMRYCNPVFTRWGIQYKGATRMRELNSRLRQLGWVRRLRTEVLDQLPPIQRVTVPIQLKQYGKYRKAETNFIKWLHKHKPTKARRLTKSAAFAMVRLNTLLQIAAELKIKDVFEWIDNFLATTNEKLCVYGHNRDFLEKIHARYKSQSVLYYGGLSHKKREHAKDTFVKDPKCRLFIGSILAAGTGINGLQTVCSKILVAQLYWVGVKLLQLEGRLWRIGQMNPVTAYYMVADRTAELFMAYAIWEKQGYLNKILDGKSSKKHEFSVLERVFKQFYKKRQKGKR